MNENQNEYVDINAHDNYPDSDQKIEIPTMKIIPLKKICMTIGQLPTAYLETLSYYEMLVWFIEYLKNNIIPTINNNASAVQEVQSVALSLQEYINNYKDSIDSDVEELEEYMNNYFENLDVQEEINNKLDQMLEDGVLTEIIQQFLHSTAIWCFDNVADMKQATNLIDGSFAKSLGYHSKNDDGGSYYKIRTITNDDVVDEKKIIPLYDNTLIAELIEKNNINVKQLGAYGNGINDDTQSIQYAIDNYSTILIPDGVYLISNSLTLKNNVTIKGETNSILKATEDVSIFENGTSSNYVTLENLELLTEIESTKYAINIEGSITPPYTGATYSIFENITINGFYSGIFVNHIWNTKFNNIRILNGTQYGIYLGGGCNNIILNNPIATNINQGIRITTSNIDTTQNTNITINNGDFEYCTTGIYMYNDETININSLYTEHNTSIIYAYGTKGLKLDGFYSSFDSKIADLSNSNVSILNGFARVNSNNDIGLISTDNYINLENIKATNNGTGKVFALNYDINVYIPLIYSQLGYNLESSSFRLRYSSEKYDGVFNAEENNGNQYSCYKPCLIITSENLVASSGDQIQLKRNGTTIATLSINNGQALNKNDILEFTASSTSAKTFIYNNGDEYSIEHTNTTGVDVNFKVLFRNIKTGKFILN